MRYYRHSNLKMTLENCKKRFEIEKARGNEELAKFWEERMERKMKHPKYAHLKEKPKTEKKPTKDSKEE